MRIVIIGGHLPPALAVIESLPKNSEVLYIGRKYPLEGDDAISLEYKTIKSLGIKFAEIKTGRWQRKFTKHTIPSLLKLPVGFLKAILALKPFKPDVVLSFGSYVSIPVVLAAYFLRVPIVIQEQTFGAGLANKFASFFATKICISWETSKKFFPESKTILTGLPIRELKDRGGKLIPQCRIKNNESLPTIYVTGGSQGSHFINTMIEGCLGKLLEKFGIIHQTGDAREYGDFYRLNSLREGLKKDLKERYMIKKFIDPYEVASIFRSADLVIGRGGIGTVSELILYQKVSLLIPLPYAGNNEQLQNAIFLRNYGVTEVIEQKDLNSSEFFDKVTNMFDNIENYKKNVAKLKGIIPKDAVKKIVEVIADVKKKR